MKIFDLKFNSRKIYNCISFVFIILYISYFDIWYFCLAFLITNSLSTSLLEVSVLNSKTDFHPLLPPSIGFPLVSLVSTSFPLVSTGFPSVSHWFPSVSHWFPSVSHWFPLVSLFSTNVKKTHSFVFGIYKLSSFADIGP